MRMGRSLRLLTLLAAAAALAALAASAARSAPTGDPLVQAFDTIPNDALWPQQWGLQAAALPEAWDVTHGSPTVVVAVVDTGVDASHPDLHGAVLPGIDLVNGDADPSDDEGHGTAVAGVIAARTDNRTGQAGACWSCLVLPIKAL